MRRRSRDDFNPFIPLSLISEDTNTDLFDYESTVDTESLIVTESNSTTDDDKDDKDCTDEITFLDVINGDNRAINAMHQLCIEHTTDKYRKAQMWNFMKRFIATIQNGKLKDHKYKDFFALFKL